MPSKRPLRNNKLKKSSTLLANSLPPELCRRLEQLDMDRFLEILEKTQTQKMNDEEHAFFRMAALALLEANEMTDKAEADQS